MKLERLIIALATFAAVAATARLGWWQLDRAAQKEAVQARLDERRNLPPMRAAELARSASTAADQHHRALTLRGRWRDDATVYLENRQMEGRPGFFVVTPLVLDDGSAVLVQRGWLPRDGQDRTRVQAPLLPTHDVEVVGRIAPPPARLFEFAAAGQGRIRQNLDLEAFAAELRLPLRPLSLLQEPPEAGPPDGLLRRWPAPAANVHKHYGYAVQWFALAMLLAGLYVWFQIIRPQRRSRAKS